MADGQQMSEGTTSDTFRPTRLPPSLESIVKIYTRTGDGGETSLLGGKRVPKNNPQVAAYGDVDELNAAIGVAAAQQPREFESTLLTEIQRDLLAIGSTLGTPAPERVKQRCGKASLGQHRVDELESAIDQVASQLPQLRVFVLPGGTTKSALLHKARTVCRRAERSVVALREHQDVPHIVLVYLNRLSDLLFVLARLANHRADVTEIEW